MLIVYLILFLIKIVYSLEIFSNHLERQPDGWIQAKEEVEVYHERYYIKADTIRYNPETKEVIAEGNVYVRSLDGRLEVVGSYAYLSLEKEEGYYLNAQGKFEKFYFQASRLEKSGELYTVEEGQITTCPPDRKEMVLCFSKAKIDQKYVFSTNNSLRLFRVPFAYLPLFFYPVGERRSGLLAPTIGFNSYNNLIYQQPIYWAISRDKDATLTIDLRDKQAKGFSLEYRQAFFKENDLRLNISYYIEPEPPGKWWEGRDPSTFRKNRYRFKFDLDLQDFKAGLDTISDPYFLEDTYLQKTERTIPYLTSYINYSKEFDRFFLSFSAKHFYDTTSSNNKRTLHRLPEVSIYWKSQQIVGSVFLGGLLSYTNFYREVGLRGQRVLFFPEISIPKEIFGKVFYSKIVFENLYYFGLNQRGYKNSINSIHFSENLSFSSDLQKGELNLRNSFNLSYSFRPKDFNNPNFDNLDKLNRKNQIDATATTSLSYAGREFLGLYLSTGYNYLNSYTYAESTVKRRVIPFRAVLSLKPFEGLSFSTDNLYDVEGGSLLQTFGSVSLGYKRTTLTLGQILSRNFSGQRLSDQTTLSLNTAYRSAVFSFSLTRDNRIKKDLTRQASLDYRGACWSFGLLARDNYDGTKGKYLKELYLTFNFFDLRRLTVPLRR